MERRHAQEAVAHLKTVGFREFQVLAARDGWDCPACAALDSGVFSVDDAPQIPPRECRCKPYGCRLVVIAWRESTQAAGAVKPGGAGGVPPVWPDPAKEPG